MMIIRTDDSLTDDSLIVTIDFPKKGYKEIPLLMVGRKTKDTMNILNVLKDSEAIQIYKKLIGENGCSMDNKFTRKEKECPLSGSKFCVRVNKDCDYCIAEEEHEADEYTWENVFMGTR